MDMNMKVQGSRSGKALGIGELLASASSAITPLDQGVVTTIPAVLTPATARFDPAHLRIL